MMLNDKLGHLHVKSYNGVSSYLVDCLVALKISELMLEEKMVLSDVDVTW
jgi:hypothetical protein